jgi:hypothetical protein
MSWRGVASPPHNTLILPAGRGGGPTEFARRTGRITTGLFAAESCTARTTAPRRFGWLGMASSPLKLQRTRRPHEPKPFGPAPKYLYLLRGHAGDGADCITPRPSFKPQATEKARNAGVERLAAKRLTIPLDLIASPLQRFVMPAIISCL